MKYKVYEKCELIIFLIISLVIIELLFCMFMFSYKIVKYHTITGVNLKNNIIEVMINKNDRKIVYKNSVFMINNKEYFYEVIEDSGVIMEKNGDYYYNILLDIKNDTKYKSHDVIEMVFKDRRVKIIDILKNVWEGD